MNSITTISIVAGTVVIIGGVAYAIYRYMNPPTNVPTKATFEVSDILNWVDEILPNIKVEDGYTYRVKVLPTEDTQQLLTRKLKNAYAILFVAQKEDKNIILKQRIIVARFLATELNSLKQGNIVEMPVEI